MAEIMIPILSWLVSIQAPIKQTHHTHLFNPNHDDVADGKKKKLQEKEKQ